MTKAARATPRPLLLGAHMSIAGGVQNAVTRAAELGCTALQIFLKNNTRWEGPPITEQQRREFRARLADSDILSVVAHASYLINIASPVEELRLRSQNALADEVRRASFLGIPVLVLHPGSHAGHGAEAGIRIAANTLRAVLEETKGSGVDILLETTAGQGTGIGRRFSELGALIFMSGGRRLGVCADTAHLHAAGYDILTRPAWIAVLNEFEHYIGLKRLRVWHLNDTPKEMGSRVDRHAAIGEGAIGLKAFRMIMTARRFSAVPKILETPKEPEPEMDRKNLALLRSLAKPSSRKEPMP